MKSTLQKAVLFIVAVLVFGLLLGTQASAADKPFYQGKTLKLIVDYSAGGPTDIECRIYARHLKKHLKGDPTIVIQNRAGGGGNLAMNWIYERARRNGTVMGCQTASGPLHGMVRGRPQESRSPSQHGGDHSGHVHARVQRRSGQDGPRSAAQEAGRPQERQELQRGRIPRRQRQGPQVPHVVRVGRRELQVRHGYQGSADLLSAFLRGELDYIDGSTPFYIPRVKPIAVDKGDGRSPLARR